MGAQRDPAGLFRRAGAWAVHLLTASGALCGLLALAGVAQGRYGTAFAWMAAALLIDSVDGTLARRLDVARTIPAIDGSLLDNLVDFLNYAVVPAFLLYSGPALPAGTGPWAASAVCLAAAFQFSHVQAKQDQRYFRGFPSYWNVVVLYLMLLRPAPWTALGIVAVLALLSFVPSLWVYPSRTPEWRRPTLVLTAAWLGCLGLLLLRYPEPMPLVLWGSLLYPAYYVALSFFLTLRHAAATRGDPSASPPQQRLTKT